MIRNNLLVGCYLPECGHTYMECSGRLIYSLRSLPEGSFLRVENVSGKLLGEYPTPGKHSCHITVLERQVITSDYTSGTLSIYPIGKDGLPLSAPEVMQFHGSGPDLSRQTSSHIHSSWVSPDGESLVVVDLGADAIYRFGIRDGGICADAPFETFRTPPGSGPRHCAFSPDGKILYVSTELSDEVLVYEYPSMALMQRIVVNESLPRGGGHIAISHDGRFVYVSSRLKEDGIAVFAVGEDGLLTRKSYMRTGAHPRHFCISSDGLTMLVACCDSDRIEVFHIDNTSGALASGGVSIPVQKPVFVRV